MQLIESAAAQSVHESSCRTRVACRQTIVSYHIADVPYVLSESFAPALRRALAGHLDDSPVFVMFQWQTAPGPKHALVLSDHHLRQVTELSLLVRTCLKSNYPIPMFVTVSAHGLRIEGYWDGDPRDSFDQSVKRTKHLLGCAA